MSYSVVLHYIALAAHSVILLLVDLWVNIISQKGPMQWPLIQLHIAVQYCVRTIKW